MENRQKNLIKHANNKDFFNLLKGEAGSWGDFLELTAQRGVACWIYQVDGKDTAAVIGEFTKSVALLAVYSGSEPVEFMDEVFLPLAKTLGCKVARFRRFRDLKDDGSWCLIERVWERKIL